MAAQGTSESFMHYPANDRCVPGAEVNSGVLNVGFGDVGNHGVTESEAVYIGRGGRERQTLTPTNNSIYIIFFRFPGRIHTDMI